MVPLPMMTQSPMRIIGERLGFSVTYRYSSMASAEHVWQEICEIFGELSDHDRRELELLPSMHPYKFDPLSKVIVCVRKGKNVSMTK